MWRALLIALAAAAILGAIIWIQRSAVDQAHAASFVVNVLTDDPDLQDDLGDGIPDGAGDGDGVCDTDAATPGDQCSLRAAVFEANANGDTADVITFGLLMGTINIGSSIPVGPTPGTGDGNADNTTIDGNGAVVIDGDAAFDCFTVTSANNVLRDLTITGCRDGIVFITDAADGSTVRANTIHGNADDAIQITDADALTIGGPASADRNFLRDNGDNGIEIAGASSGHTIERNYIGTSNAGNAAQPNGGHGILDLSSSGTTIRNNVLSANLGDGLHLAMSSSNTVQGNLIGIGADGVTPLGNGDDGIELESGAGSNLIGGTTAQANRIAHNGDAGIEASGATTDFNQWRRNSIFLNGGQPVDLAADDVATQCPPDDGGAAGDGSNDDRDCPDITSISFAAGEHTVAGVVNPAEYPSGSEVDVYKADAQGEPQTYLGTAVVSNTGPTATWDATVCGLTPGDVVVAIATDTSGNSSEVSLFSDPDAIVGSDSCLTPPTSTPTATPTATHTPTPTSTPEPDNAMLIDADAGEPGVDTDILRFVNDNFDTTIDVTMADAPYDTYQFLVEFDAALIAFVSGTHLQPDGFNICFDYTVFANGVSSACSRSGGGSIFTGSVESLTFSCIGEGVSALHLASTAEDPLFGTTTILFGNPIPTDLSSANVECLDGDADHDGDGCTTARELGPNKSLGGQRDPFNPYDFYDITDLTAVVGARDMAITGFDLSLLVNFGGTSDGGPPNASGHDYDDDSNANTIDDGREIDYASIGGPATGPDGAITGFDLSAIVNQGGDDCTGAP